MTWVIVAIVVVVVLGAVGVIVRRRAQGADGVEMFQRQIDALSPEARRPVVDQVQQLDPDADDPDDRDDPRGS
ncbi:MAG: hypothetical protein H0U21_09215 [Acidimicrobiia bacterium]|nr:hypothetical protein [Acidimicrobiia bacterium]